MHAEESLKRLETSMEIQGKLQKSQEDIVASQQRANVCTSSSLVHLCGIFARKGGETFAVSCLFFSLMRGCHAV